MGLMDLMDLFSNDEKKIARHTRRVTNRDAQPEDREASARWLADHGAPEALMGLMARFDMNLEHQLKDKGEKELVFSLLLDKGHSALGPIRSWLKRGRQFAFPLRLLEEMEGREAAVAQAFEMLQVEADKDDFKPEKKTGILVWLAEVHDPRVFELVPHFLKDFDEGVRYAASEVLVAQRDDRAREPLLGLLSNPDEESNRLKVRVTEIFVARGWQVDASLQELLPQGFTVRNDRVYSTR
ncbi:MAG: HEAT repeat domain-containing protein [Deltaproteobacteria bacterium]|nr:HEAT repeat domain-containing protein [Deltaproteobacteria bacterium]